MGWLDKWFDEKDWPKDPALDAFRNSVWKLSRDGTAVGWITTSVMPMRSFPLLGIKQEQMWSQVHWMDGRHEYCEEDYGPDWPVVEELSGGHFRTFEPGGGSEIDFEAVTVTGAERDQLWAFLEHGREPHARG